MLNAYMPKLHAKPCPAVNGYTNQRLKVTKNIRGDKLGWRATASQIRLAVISLLSTKVRR